MPFMIAAGSVLVLVGLWGVIVHYVDSRRQFALVAAALAPFLMASAIPGMVLFASAGLWIGAGAGLAVTVAAIASQWPLFRARMKSVPPGRSELVVMQANILVGRADPHAVVEAVDRLDVDVLTLSELTPRGLDALIGAGLTNRLPYSYAGTGPGGSGTAIFSRFPLSNCRRHNGFENEVLSATVAFETGASATVFAVHPVPPWPRDPSTWSAELELLRQLLADVPADANPVIVAGDFNATYDHKRFRNLLRNGYQDAAVATGAGIITTYAADKWYPAIISIDHILTRCATARTVAPVVLPGSDHRGVWCRIGLL